MNGRENRALEQALRTWRYRCAERYLPDGEYGYTVLTLRHHAVAPECFDLESVALCHEDLARYIRRSTL